MSGAVGCDGLQDGYVDAKSSTALAGVVLGTSIMPEREEDAAASLTLQPRADVCARQLLGLSHFRRFAERVLRGNEAPRFPDCNFIASAESLALLSISTNTLSRVLTEPIAFGIVPGGAFTEFIRVARGRCSRPSTTVQQRPRGAATRTTHCGRVESGGNRRIHQIFLPTAMRPRATAVATVQDIGDAAPAP